MIEELQYKKVNLNKCPMPRTLGHQNIYHLGVVLLFLPKRRKAPGSLKPNLSIRVLQRESLTPAAQYLGPHLRLTSKRIPRPVSPALHNLEVHVPRFLHLDHQGCILQHDLPSDAQPQRRQASREEHGVLVRQRQDICRVFCLDIERVHVHGKEGDERGDRPGEGEYTQANHGNDEG